jgi:hypothetical protein
MRKSTLAMISLAVLLGLFVLTFVDAAIRQLRVDNAAGQALVRELGLTDLCLFTEARYTRHLSQADIHTPFQDHPAALEHFPSGSLLSPPYENLSRAAAVPD